MSAQRSACEVISGGVSAAPPGRNWAGAWRDQIAQSSRARLLLFIHPGINSMCPLRACVTLSRVLNELKASGQRNNNPP